MKSDFPALKDWIYLDSAATAQKPKCVIDAISNFYQEEYATVHRAVYQMAAESTEKYSSVRRKVASWIHARQEEEIIFTKGTTDAINLIARSLGDLVVEEGDEILITAMEHHANIIPWQMLAKRKKARLVVAPLDERGDIDVSQFASLLSARTKIVSFTHISNVLGTINPVKELVKIARRYPLYIVVDGAQGIVHEKVDVQDFDVDFYAFSGHKIYGPTGVGILYGKKEILDMMPPVQGGGDMVDTVSFETASYQETPLKFEAGTPMIASVIGLGTAVDYIQNLSFDHEKELLQYAEAKLSSIEGLKILANPKQRAPLFTFTLEGLHPLDIANLLSFKKIAIRTGTFCAQPLLHSLGIQAACRVSFGIYNSREDVDALYKALMDIRALALV
ncbi:MAG: SufS family cysteine desulfurase [Chlamydiae bacterium]|nr:SufS family cysteine desulfurase [Chlamydiota bacterium]